MTITDKHMVEFVYYITPDGVQYPLFGGGRAMLGWTAFGLPPLHYIKDRGPFQHGSTVRDFRLDDRVLDLQPYETGCERQDYWDHQGALLDAIRPNRGGPGRILVILPDFTEREIFVRILSGPSGDYDATGGQLVSDVRETLRFEAANPVWRDPNIEDEIFVVTPADSCLPRCLPFCIGSGVINSTVSITYPGTWLTYPTIVITGPIDEPIVENLTTGEAIELNYNVAAGEVVIITLGQEKDEVINNFGDNLIGTVKNPSDLATFHIEAAPLAPGGVNVIRVIGSNGDPAVTGVDFSYYINYLGVPK